MIYLFLSIFTKKYWTENYEAVLYRPYDYNSRYFRIPAITTAKDGTLVTATDMRWINKNDLPANISVGIRRSLDDGKTWTENEIISGPPRNEGDGDPALVTDRKTGTIICLWNGEVGFFHGTQQNPEHLYVTRSYDNGVTWEPKRDITSTIYSNLCTTCSQDRYTWSSMFISSGSALQLRDGRIMAAGVTRCWGQTRVYTVYSDDLGETWTASENPACKTADESKFFERNDGVVVISVRHKPQRIFAYSPDRGITWENETNMNDIWDSPCNGEVIRFTSTIDGYDKDRLLHSVTYVQNFPRRNVTILLSYDEGKTWPIKKTLRGDPQLLGSYSTMSIGHTGLIHVYYEKGVNDKDPDDFNMTVHTFSLEWLTDGKDTYKKAENLKWCICENKECFDSCPKGFYHSSTKVFDQYVESYFEYPTNMAYISPKGLKRDFYVDLAVPGLKNASYLNSDGFDRPTISLKNLNKLDDDDEKEEKLFSLSNVNVNVNFDQLCLNKFVLKEKSLLNVNGSINKIEVGKTKVRITNTLTREARSKIVDIEGNKATVNVLNELVNENAPLEVFSGIDGLDGEDEAAVPLKITASKPNTKIKINGNWNGQKLITIASDNSGTKVITNSENKDLFVVEGESPTFDYIYPPQTPTEVPVQTPTKEPTEEPTKEPTEKPTKVPTKEPTKEPTKVPTVPSTPSDNINNGDGSKKDDSINKILIIVVVAVSVIAIAAIIVAVVIFVKMKKRGAINDMKSEKETNEPLRAPLLF